MNGIELFQSVADECKRFVGVTEDERTAISLWIIWSYVHDAFQHSPLLIGQSPVPGCGKTTMGRFIAAHAACPLITSNLTPAVLRRLAPREDERHTLILDEADTYVFGDSQIVGVLNSGHTRSTALVHRVSLKDFQVEELNVWMPKVLLYIGTAPRPLMDRAIAINLRRLLPHEQVDIMPYDYTDRCEERRASLARWAEDKFDLLEQSWPLIPSGLHNRTRDNWRGLLAVADAVGGYLPDRAREVATALSGTGGLDLREVLLRDIRLAFLQTSEASFSTHDLVKWLNALDGDAPWGHLNDGEGLDPRRLAEWLQPFDIRPSKLPWSGKHRNVRGYRRSAFSEAFKRYLPPIAEGPEAPEGN